MTDWNWSIVIGSIFPFVCFGLVIPRNMQEIISPRRLFGLLRRSLKIHTYKPLKNAITVQASLSKNYATIIHLLTYRVKAS